MKQELGTALVTGASAGIGAALAREFAGHGHDVILAARTRGKLQKLARELERDHGVHTEVVPCDLGAPDASEQLHDEVQRRRLEVDILVNNAGLLYEGPFWKTRLADHRQLLQVNIVALTELAYRFLPAMIQRRRGRILNVSSTSAFQPVPQLSTYAASKSFVLSLSEALNIELKGTGVKVTALCPGFTETDMIVKDGGRKMKLPFVRNMTAEEVAAQGYDACVAGRALYINGASNRTLITFGKHQPRWLQRRIAELVGKKSVL